MPTGVLRVGVSSVAKVSGKVLVHRHGSGRVTDVLQVSWPDSPKAARAKAAVQAVRLRFARAYQGQSFEVDPGNIGKDGDGGAGTIFINGEKVYHFAAVADPESETASDVLFGRAR